MTVGTVIWIIILILLLNTTAAIITVFKEKRDIAATWAWLLVLNLLPVVGFVIYLFAGKKISKEKIFADSGTDRNQPACCFAKGAVERKRADAKRFADG